MSDVEKGETVVASAAVPVAVAATDIPMRDQEKIGAKCCGCLCDYRRAVVAISIIYIVRYIIAIIFTTTGATLVGTANAESFNMTEEEQTTMAISMGGAAAAWAILLCCNIFSLVAALRYSVCMLSTVVLLILAGFGWNIYEIIAVSVADTGVIIGSIIVVSIGCALALYPVVGLILEIKSGIMSKETYPREAYSCCCSPKV